MKAKRIILSKSVMQSRLDEALMFAAECADAEKLEELIHFGANPSAFHGQAVLYATQTGGKGAPAAVKILLESGINLTTSSIKCALVYSWFDKENDAITLLLEEHGVKCSDIDAKKIIDDLVKAGLIVMNADNEETA